jgi:hypothetical protein
MERCITFSEYLKEHVPVVFRAEGAPMLIVIAGANATCMYPAWYSDEQAIAEAKEAVACWAADVSDGGNAD